MQRVKKELPFKIHRAVWKNNDEKLARLLAEKDRKGHTKHSLLNVDKHKRFVVTLKAC